VQWTSESSTGSTEEVVIEEAPTVAVQESKSHAEGSKIETPKGHGRPKAEKTNMQGLSKEKKETESPPPRHDRNSTTTVRARRFPDVAGQPSEERGFYRAL